MLRYGLIFCQNFNDLSPGTSIFFRQLQYVQDLHTGNPLLQGQYQYFLS